MNQIPMFFTNQEMSSAFMKKLREGYEGDCPCCGRYAKIYKRQVHTGTALQLIKLYRIGGGTEYIHASRLIAEGVSGSGDFTKAKYFGLIQDLPANDERKKKSGWWMLTGSGVAFVLNFIRIPDYVLVFDDAIVGRGDKLVGIAECLGNKFDYQKMMEE